MLKRLREFIQLLQHEGNAVEFSDLCVALRNAMADNISVYLADKNGELLGHALAGGLESTEFDSEWISSGKLPSNLNNSLLKLGATGELDGPSGEKLLAAPVIGASRRVGSLVFAGQGIGYNNDDLTIAEFAATTIGIIIANAIDGEEEDEAQEVRLARSAIKSLSYSEILAMQHIFDELDGDEGLLVASRIADNAGITRSVIVNALRKLASANVVESRSLGMKGTYLRILNKEIRNEFERQRYPYPKAEPSERKKA